LSVCEGNSTYRMSGSCPVVAVSCSCRDHPCPGRDTPPARYLTAAGSPFDPRLRRNRGDVHSTIVANAITGADLYDSLGRCAEASIRCPGNPYTCSRHEKHPLSSCLPASASSAGGTMSARWRFPADVVSG
jgi:hypothetical protein